MMTNPTPDYYDSFKVNFGSSGAGAQQRPIEKLGLSSVVEGNHLPDALLPETPIGSTSSMELKKLNKNPTTINIKKPLVSCMNNKKQDENNKKKAGSKRKLTFKVDDKDEMIEEIYSYPFPSDMDDNDGWWMDEELDELLTEAMLVADHFTRKRKDWQNKIKSILKCVAGRNKKKDGTAPPVTLKASDLDFVVDSEARGLELYIHPIFQKHREKAIKGVVKVQEEYNAAEKKKGKADPELRLKVLRAQSLKLTNLARLMAKTLADGDRRVVLKGEEKQGLDNAAESSEELDSKSDSSGEFKAEGSKPAPRPRVRSPMRGVPRRTISPRRAQQLLASGGLKDLEL